MKQKTRFFKIIAFTISFILLLTIFSTISIAKITEETNTGTITVSGIEVGVTVYLYQLTTVNYDYDSDEPQTPLYTWVENVKSWIDEEYPQYSDPETFSTKVTSDSETAESFYSDLSAAIKGDEFTLEPTQEKSVDGTQDYPVVVEELEGSVTFSSCAMGTYLILIENGYMVYTPSVVNLTPEYNSENKQWELDDEVQVKVKATNPQITKYAMITETEEVNNFRTNEIIYFRIEADVPKYAENSVSTSYYISDKSSGGLTFSGYAYVYGIKGSTTFRLRESEGYYTLTTNATLPNDEQTEVDVLIEFDYDKISSYNKIQIYYGVTLNKNSSTVIGADGNKNYAYLHYSNNPYSDSSLQEQKSEATIYTYGVEITKVDKSNNNTILPGAQFQLKGTARVLYLSIDQSNYEVLWFVKDKDGVYYLADRNDENATTTLVVDDNGKLYIYGLSEGTYYLEETKAPDGYNLSTTPGQIVITDTNKDGALDDASEGDTSGIYKLTFENSQVFQLPVTGGIGIAIFIAGGIILIGLGVTLFIFVIKKRRAN